MQQAINPIDPNTNNAEKYELLIKQAEAIVSSESDLIANMANLTALLKDTFNWFWIGFYRVDTESNQLVLGPFQGPLACTFVSIMESVCGRCGPPVKPKSSMTLMHINHCLLIIITVGNCSTGKK